MRRSQLSPVHGLREALYAGQGPEREMPARRTQRTTDRLSVERSGCDGSLMRAGGSCVYGRSPRRLSRWAERMTTTDALDRARDSFGRHAWADAYAQLDRKSVVE